MLCFIVPKVLFKIAPDSVKGEVCKYIANGFVYGHLEKVLFFMQEIHVQYVA